MMRPTVRLCCQAILIAAGFQARSLQADPLPAFTLYQPNPQLEIGSQTGDPLPIMVTYELKKQRTAARAIARDPKGFWIRQIVTRIEASKQDTPQALKEARIVRLSFVIARDGHLMSKSVSTSSGSTIADKAAVAMLDRAQPFPPMPDTMPDSELTFTLPVRFR